MNEIRIDPVKDQKVVYAVKRQDRTYHPPKDYCPLCPTKGKGVDTEIAKNDYDIVVFENKFPSFLRQAKDVKDESCLNSRKAAKGICEVICYSSGHDSFLEDQDLHRIENLIYVWSDRYRELQRKEYIDYVFIFENKGTEIGVTLSHPHGQIYGFNHIPPLPYKELLSSKEYFNNNHRCIHCDILKNEISEDSRIIYRDKHFISFIPFSAQWPFEVHIYPLRHLGSINCLKSPEINSLARTLKDLILRYNRLFNRRMPYVMIAHQNPTDGKEYPYYHFHFEFYPPYRTSDKLKFLAGCELGAGMFINDTFPEEKAKMLKQININRKEIT
jgi:UDPglucose--hexose-1-phosphate uridylyltransferase